MFKRSAYFNKSSFRSLSISDKMRKQQNTQAQIGQTEHAAMTSSSSKAPLHTLTQGLNLSINRRSLTKSSRPDLPVASILKLTDEQVCQCSGIRILRILKNHRILRILKNSPNFKIKFGCFTLYKCKLQINLQLYYTIQLIIKGKQ